MIKHLTLPKKMAAMVLLAGAALSTAPVQAASWPTKQIELVVPYAAGGGTDLCGPAQLGGAGAPAHRPGHRGHGEGPLPAGAGQAGVCRRRLL